MKILYPLIANVFNDSFLTKIFMFDFGDNNFLLGLAQLIIKSESEEVFQFECMQKYSEKKDVSNLLLQYQAYFNRYFYLSNKDENVEVWVGKYQDYRTYRFVLIEKLELLLKEYVAPKSEFAERFHSFYHYDNNNAVYNQSESEFREIRNSLLDVSMDVSQTKLDLNKFEELNFLSLFLKRQQYFQCKAKLRQLELEVDIYRTRLSYFVDI